MAEAVAHSPAGSLRLRMADPLLILAVAGLSGVGLVMVYSASSALALARNLPATFYFTSQLMHLAVGVAVMLMVANLDYDHLRRWSPVFYLISLVLLALVFVPGLGHRAGGAARWLRLGISVQPSEVAKLTMAVYLAYWLSAHQEFLKTFSRGMLPGLGIIMAPVALIIIEPDMGMSMMFVAIGLTMLFVAGVRLSYLIGLVVLMSPAVAMLAVLSPYRFQRLLVFLDPWPFRLGSGFQIVHSLLAFGSGGVFGAGLGDGKQKLFYLPEPHTDFIFSVLGEELGMLGVVLVLGLFMLLCWRGAKIALSARDLFGTFLALGATLIIGFQAFVNAGVVMSVLPTTGLTLPFISAGGSSLVTSFICAGLIYSVAKHRGKKA